MNTGDFAQELVKLGAALAVMAGTVHFVNRYSPAAAWSLTAIILLGVFVYQSNRTPAIDDFLSAVFGRASLLSNPPRPAVPPQPPQPPYPSGY